jgi:hypothetical protein
MRRNGVVSLKGKPALGEHCDPRVIKNLGVSAELLHLPERVGGVIGFDAAHAVARDIANSWARHALIEDHIMPKGAASSHKAEQALLTALLCKAEAQGLISLTQDEVDISSGGPMRWITTRNKVQPWMPRAADGLVRLYYYLWKSGDQFNHRFRDWERRRIGGTERRYREHYQVSVQKDGLPPVAIPSPEGGYYADPFPLEVGGKTYLLVEEFSYAKARGHLTCISLAADLKPIHAKPFLPMECHASFPYVFSYGGVTYLVPETHEARSVDLFTMGAEPTSWTLSRRLLYGVDATDTVIVRANGLWWLLTSVLDEGAGNRHLEVFHAKDLLQDEFVAHPVNQKKLYQDAQFGTGRNAGAYLRTAAGFIRPMQSSTRHYGEGMQLMLIKQLNTENFEEAPASQVTGYSDVVDALSPHHVAQAGDVLAWDVRDLAR